MTIGQPLGQAAFGQMYPTRRGIYQLRMVLLQVSDIWSAFGSG